VSDETGISNSPGKGWGVVAADQYNYFVKVSNIEQTFKAQSVKLSKSYARRHQGRANETPIIKPWMTLRGPPVNQ
jgi:hypothetical protein